MADHGDFSIDGMTISAVLRHQARVRPLSAAAIFSKWNARFTFAQYDAAVDQIAKALIAAGIRHGEHFAVWATNWPAWPLLQLATARVGVVLVTVNPAYREHELAYVLNQSDAVAVAVVDRFKTSDYFAMLLSGLPGCENLRDAFVGQQSASQSSGINAPVVPAAPKLRHVISLAAQAPAGGWAWDEFLALGESVSDAELHARESATSANEPINIQYTSGTTGFPKGATLSHRNILLNGWYVGECQAFTAEDRLCVPVPFYHCFGCVLGVLACLTHGACIVVPDDFFSADATLRAIAQERCTAVYGVPTMFIAMLDSPVRETVDLSSLRTGVMAGSPCPLEVMQRVVQQLGCREITIAYGLTEAAPVITQTRIDDPIELRVSTVGRPLPGVEVRIVDPATGRDLGDEESGELCCKGHGVMLGYYNMPQQTAMTIDAAGWLHSGDVACRQSNGFYRITGRIKDMVCRGGENIYPREIEEVLYRHAAVQDVAVVGVPDSKYIEELAAWIRLRPGVTVSEEEIRQFCSGMIAKYKIPRYIRFVNEFPQTVTGKIQKFRIREEMINSLGLHAAANRDMA